MTTFFLVRHGVTSHTGHRLSGRMRGIHLNAEGMAQAEVAADRLAGVKFDAIYSSPIDRCRETARAIAERHGMDVRVEPGLIETEYGRWTNRSFKSLRNTKAFARIQRWPSSIRFPEGETLRDVQLRAVDAIERLRKKHPKGRVCCVAHSDSIKLVVTHYLGMHMDMLERFSIAPTSLTVLSVTDERPVLLALNAGLLG